MKNNLLKIILLISISSFCLCETGMVMKKGESGIGMWGSITKNLNCSSCDATRSLTFDYLTPIGLQISYSIMGHDRATQLAYYLKTKNNNLSFRHKTTDLDDVFYDYDPVLIGVRWFNKSGFTIEASNWSYDYINYEIVSGDFWCYDGYYYWNYEAYENQHQCTLSEWVEHTTPEYDWQAVYSHTQNLDYDYVDKSVNHNYITIGKYIKVNSFVMGLEYTNQIEELDDPNSGSLSFKVGTLF